MLNIFTSAVKEPNKHFEEKKRLIGEDNLQWLTRVMRRAKKGDTSVLLLGGSDLSAFRLRVAQSQLRHDLTPSSWSHVVLLGNIQQDLGMTVIHEISLEPTIGFASPIASNALQRAILRDYLDEKRYPNIAYIRVPVRREDVTEALVKYQGQRAIADGPQLILLWLAYLWGAGRAGNPLIEGHGMPSAAMIEVVIGAVGFDLTPGLESRSSCPEAIWQAAKWWHEYYKKDKAKKSLTGAYTKEHDFLQGVERPPEAGKPKGPPTAEDYANPEPVRMDQKA